MTIKEYYKDPFLSKCVAKLISISENSLCFDKTIAFPEGGGQIGDSGKIINLKTKEEIQFFDTQKEGGRKLHLKDFPEIFVEGDIIHLINKEDFDKVEVGEEYQIIINTEKRAKATINHSGIHLVLMELEKIRPDSYNKVCGARISDKSARLDFITNEKFSKEELSLLSEKVNEKINKAIEIKAYYHPEEKEAWFWECDDYSIPCGGTHLENTSFLGSVKLKRKNIGKNSDRIIAQFENYKLPQYR